MAVDREALDSALRRLSDLVPADWGGLEDVTKHATAAVHDLFGLSGAGLMVIDTAHVLRSVAATDASGDRLEEAQQRAADGPCIQAFIYDRITATDDINADARWPQLIGALRGSNVHAVMGVPVRLGGGPIGVLNVYEHQPHRWTDEERRALEGFSGVLATLLTAGIAAHRSDTLAQQLQYALDYRVVIERGIGFMMALEKVDAVTAFARLRRAARDSRRKVGDIAADLLAGKSLDPPP